MILSMVVFTSLSHHAGDMSSHSLRAWGEGGGDGGGEGDGGGGDGGGLRRERGRNERNSTTSATSTADAALAPLRRNMRRVFMGRRAGRTTECSRRAAGERDAADAGLLLQC